MSSALSTPRITSVHPAKAVPGGRVAIRGHGLTLEPRLPAVRIGDAPARVVRASTERLDVIVPGGDGGRLVVHVDGVAGDPLTLDVGVGVASGLHLVDSPVFGPDGTLYVTYSGSRDQRTPVSIYRIPPGGVAEAYSSVANPTSLAVDAGGHLLVSSRFEGTVYRLQSDGTPTVLATDLGVPCGLAVDADGTVFVGDRSGSLLRVRSDGTVSLLASLPASVAAFHLALGRDGSLYVTGPTLASRDVVYRVSSDGVVERMASGFGRPQGLAVDARGTLFVVEALAGASGVHRVEADGSSELVVAGTNLIGIAFDGTGGFVVASSESIFRFDGAARESA